MKNILKLMFLAFLAFGLFACGEKKLTREDLKAAEATLFNEDKSINEAKAPQVAEKYCKFVEQNPNDSTADLWLYHAMEINVMLKNADKSEEICHQLLETYPKSEWAPVSLFLLGSYVYNDILNDTAKAHVAYQQIIDNYPESHLAEDAKKSIEYLGLTPDEILSRIVLSQMEVEEDSEE